MLSKTAKVVISCYQVVIIGTGTNYFGKNVSSENSVVENSFSVSHEFVLVLGLNQLYNNSKGKNRMKFNSKCSSSFFYIDIVSTLKHPARSSSRVVFVQPGFQQMCERCPVGFFQKGQYIQFRQLVDGWMDGW